MRNLYYPLAELTITKPNGCGEMNRDGSKKVVWHTTETPPSAFYTRNTYYHIQVREDPYTGEVSWRQMIPFNVASCALKNGPHPVQTNRDGDVCINVAIVGYAKDSPQLSPAMIRAIALFMVWAELEWGVPAEFPLELQGGEAYGPDGVGRLNEENWDQISGNVGHQDVADGNAHWDPGKLPARAIEAEIKNIKEELTMALKDVPRDYVHRAAIEWLVEKGLTTQVEEFRPNEPVTRGQMASFMKRLYDLIKSEEVN